ncbi:MAG: hypothetical protein JWQ54_4214 [Mucilaginibacter sp.]|nr:hypothetical protein [Mucilaginibacter sp.]
MFIVHVVFHLRCRYPFCEISIPVKNIIHRRLMASCLFNIVWRIPGAHIKSAVKLINALAAAKRPRLLAAEKSLRITQMENIKPYLYSNFRTLLFPLSITNTTPLLSTVIPKGYLKSAFVLSPSE